jgi:hypothetical protein
VAGTEHKTILGKIKFAGSENVGTPGTVSQWQKGEFEVVWRQAAGSGCPPSGLWVEPRQSRPVNLLPASVSPFGAWFELIASGLITGGIYALVALGLNLQYGLMRILNIAHGEFLMLGALPHLGGADGLGLSPLLMIPCQLRLLMAWAGDPPAVLPAADGHQRPTWTCSRRAA